MISLQDFRRQFGPCGYAASSCPRNNGLMCPQPGTIQPSKKSKKRKGSTAPAPASKRLLGADGPGTTGAIPAGPVQVQKRGCDEATWSKKQARAVSRMGANPQPSNIFQNVKCYIRFREEEVFLHLCR